MCCPTRCQVQLLTILCAQVRCQELEARAARQDAKYRDAKLQRTLLEGRKEDAEERCVCVCVYVCVCVNACVGGWVDRGECVWGGGMWGRSWECVCLCL
jgi:hypothetical protein